MLIAHVTAGMINAAFDKKVVAVGCSVDRIVRARTRQSGGCG
jgi:hypothetical protein